MEYSVPHIHNTCSLFLGVVINIHYPDDWENLSRGAAAEIAGHKVGDAVIAAADDAFKQEDLYNLVVGTRVEYDVLILSGVLGVPTYDVIKNVPMMQYGGSGIDDADIRVPRSLSNWDGEFPIDLSRLDGDIVIVGCIGGIYPRGAVILGWFPSMFASRDAPFNISGTPGINVKKIGDTLRKDGKVRFQRCNGTAIRTDRFGNYIINTTEANQKVSMDSLSGGRVVVNDNVPYNAAGDVAPLSGNPSGNLLPLADNIPGNYRQSKELENAGGGDIIYELKNTRRFRIEFQDNTKMVISKGRKIVPQYKETGFIQVTNTPAGREIDIVMSDSVVINVRKFDSGSGNLAINVDGDVTLNASGSTIDIDSASVINLGSSVQTLATADFGEKVMVPHVHDSPGGLTTGPGVDIPMVGFSPFSWVGGKVSVVGYDTGDNMTTKVKGE